jgi:hypothetical protein
MKAAGTKSRSAGKCVLRSQYNHPASMKSIEENPPKYPSGMTLVITLDMHNLISHPTDLSPSFRLWWQPVPTQSGQTPPAQSHRCRWRDHGPLEDI